MIISRTSSGETYLMQKPFLSGWLGQLLWGFLLSSLLPTLVVYLIWQQEAFNYQGLRNSAIACVAAFVGGLFWYRRLIKYPGVQGVENILTAFFVSFTIAVAALPILRMDYNRTYLFTSFVLTLAGFVVIVVRSGLNAHPKFHLVPFGHVGRLMSMTKAHWSPMTTPNIPTHRSAGIVADLRADLPDDWQRMIADAVLAGIPVFHVKQIDEALSGQVDIEHLSENQFGLLSPSPAYRNLKNSLDIALAVLMLPLLAIPFIIVAIAIRLDSEGPIFFRQSRVGYRGQTFRVFKFRTMRHAPISPADVRDSAMTKEGDPRITRVGRILRRYRIDEITQIINVLKGEMSWIGPRPEAVPLSEWYQSELPFYQYRHAIKPGVTGWAQVNQGHVTDLKDAHDKLKYDFYYIKFFSVWMDLLIVVRTMRIIFSGFGSR